MNGQSCPTCGWMLRWLPEQGAWGCDRCRQVLPAAQVAPPQQQMQMQPPQMPPPPQPAGYAPQGSPYAPQGGPAPGPYSPHAPHAMMSPGMPPPGYPMPGPPRRGSSKGLAIGLGVGGVAVAGAIIAIVVARGGGGGGVGSREDLVKRALTAMGDGDVEKLVKLSDPVGLYNAVLDCSEREKRKQDRDKDKDKDEGDEDRDKDDASDDDDPQMQETRIRHKYEKLVDKMKGVKIELVSIAGEKDQKDDKDDSDSDSDSDSDRKRKGDGMKKGDKATKGCVFKVDVQFHELVAKVRVTERDSKEPSEQKAKLTAIDAGGSWYLMAPPKLSDGDGDGDGGGDGDGDTAAEVRKALAKMESFKAKMCACTDRACAERVQKEMTDWSASMAKTSKTAKPRDEDMKKFTAVAMAFGECQVKAMAMDSTPPPEPPPPEPPPPPEDGTSSGDGADLASLPGCAEYRRQIDNARACAKYPRSTVTALRQSWDQLEKSWATARSNPGTRQQMTAACEALADSVKKAIERMCP